MARDERPIEESREQLIVLSASTNDERARLSIAVLLLMQQYPAWTFMQIAEQLACSDRTVKRRWATYRKGGINALLNNSVPQLDEPMRKLRVALNSGELPDSEELGQWLAKHLVNEEKHQLVALLSEALQNKPSDAEALIPERVIMFLNALKPEGAAGKWNEQCRDALLAFLPDVDHVSLKINLNCDLSAPESYQPEAAVSQHHDQTSPSTTHLAGNQPGDHARRILSEYQDRKFPFEQYHPPSVFIYFHGGAYLAAVTLWRKREMSPIAVTTLRLMERLRPFLEAHFAGIVGQFRHVESIGISFIKGLERLVPRFGLTVSEQQLIIRLSQGESHKEAADVLNISPRTVDAQLQSIYQKTGVRSILQLVVLYLMPGSDIR